MNATSVRVPKSMATSQNCIVLPVGNTHTFPGGRTIHRGELAVFDLERCPKHGDIVLMKWPGRDPFARECYIAPLDLLPRDCWSMGVEDRKDDGVVFFSLGEAEWVGVLTGTLPAASEAATA